MEIYELLDRFELLYEDVTPDISDLRRTVIDKDLPSLFQILKKYEDKELRLKKGIKNRSYGKKYFDIACHTKNMNEVFNSVKFTKKML